MDLDDKIEDESKSNTEDSLVNPMSEGLKKMIKTEKTHFQWSKWLMFIIIFLV